MPQPEWPSQNHSLTDLERAREYAVQLLVKYAMLTTPKASVLWLTSSKKGREVSRNKMKIIFYKKKNI